MSVISSTHSLSLFTSGVSKPLHDQRLAKITYKPRENKPAKFASVCASIPMIREITEENLDAFLPHLVKVMENAQDGIIKAAYESNGGKMISIRDEDINETAILNFLNAESSGSRINADMVNTWFDLNVKDNLSVMLAGVLKFDDELNEEQQVVVNKHVGVYKDIMALIAGKQVHLQGQQQKAIRKCFELADTDSSDSVHSKLVERFDSICGQKDIGEILGL